MAAVKPLALAADGATVAQVGAGDTLTQASAHPVPPWMSSPLPDAFMNFTPGPVTTLAFTVGSAYFWPLLLPAMTLQSIQGSVTTLATGGTALLGIYGHSAGNLPNVGNLVADCGTVSTATTGLKVWNTTATLTGGMYWICFLALVAAPTMRIVSNSTPYPVGFRPGENAPDNANHCARVITGLAALPTSGTDVINTNPILRLRFRAAT
jgi:hypothetical protein